MRGPPPSLPQGSLEMEVAQIKPGGPNSALQAAVQPRISPGRPSRGVTPLYLGFGEGPACAGPLPPRLRGGLETEEAQIKPEQHNSARPAAVQPRISPGLPLRGATPPSLGFGEGPAHAGPLPPSLRGSLKTEVALLKSERPYSARPVAVQPRISPGSLSRGATPPCLGFGEGPACGAPSLPASGAVSRRKWSKLSLSDLTQPAQPRISPGWPSHGATPPCLGFGNGPVRRDPLPPRLRSGLESKVALFMPGVPISARPAPD